MWIRSGRSLAVAGWWAVILALAACGRSADDPMEEQTHVVRGMVRYADPLPLSNQARMVGQLLHDPAGEPRIVAETVLEPPGQVPIPFELQYAPADVPRDAALAVQIEVYDENELLFVSDPPERVGRTRAAEIVEITLTPTEEGRARIAALPEEEEPREVEPALEPPDYDPGSLLPAPEIAPDDGPPEAPEPLPEDDGGAEPAR